MICLDHSQKHAISPATVRLRPITDEDGEFLFRLYASTRLDEMAATGWNETQVEAFLRMQFNLQHTQYMQNYPDASFDVIVIDDVPAGRIYVERTESGMRLIDISLLPEFRGQGIGGRILRELTDEADAKGLAMSLHVEINNPVREFYKALGFREKELRGIYYYMERELRHSPQVSRGGEIFASRHIVAKVFFLTGRDLYLRVQIQRKEVAG